jgi:hypothetical protein
MPSYLCSELLTETSIGSRVVIRCAFECLHGESTRQNDEITRPFPRMFLKKNPANGFFQFSWLVYINPIQLCRIDMLPSSYYGLRSCYRQLNKTFLRKHESNTTLINSSISLSDCSRSPSNFPHPSHALFPRFLIFPIFFANENCSTLGSMLTTLVASALKLKMNSSAPIPP